MEMINTYSYARIFEASYRNFVMAIFSILITNVSLIPSPVENSFLYDFTIRA